MGNHVAESFEVVETKVDSDLPAQVDRYPEFRYMGSKRRLLPWVHGILVSLDFQSAWDPFVGSGCVSYLMKSMGKRVVVSDFLNFPTVIAGSLIENPGKTIESRALKKVLNTKKRNSTFIQDTFSGVFFSMEDLRFLDHIAGNIESIEDLHKRAIVMTALIRSCVKKQPRGVFTITGDLSRYDDGRRDLRLTIEEHFFEQIQVINEAVFSNGKANRAKHVDFFDANIPKVDLVYLDPPYVPRSDDNCYVKRYHFLEGLSCYWKGLSINTRTKSKKIHKKFTPFSYRSKAIRAFHEMFGRLKNKKIALSYSSNGFPDLETLFSMLEKYKDKVTVYSKPHRYHFGTHDKVKRSKTTEYLIVGE